MSVNLMDLAKGMIGQQIGKQIGSIVGLDDNGLATAIGSALPSLIGGLANKAGSQSGVEDIARVMDNQDDGLLDSLGDMLGGSNQQNFMNGGNGILSSVLGGHQSGIVNLIMRATGLSNTKIGPLLSILAPIVIGLVKRQSKSQNLGIGGLGELLKGQRQHVESSLPPGFDDLVGIGKPGGASRPAGGGSLLGKLLPLGLLLAAGYLLLQFLPGMGGKKAEPDNQGIVQPDVVVPGSTLEDGPLQDALDSDSIQLRQGPLSDAIEGDSTTVEGSEVELQLEPNQ